jgi:hypothetical protein
MHRHGKKSDLCDDYVMLIMPGMEWSKVESERQKIEKIWEILSRHEAELVNFGTLRGGGRHRKSINEFKQQPQQLLIINAVFRKSEAFQTCLKEIQEGDFGISVTISGPFEDVKQTCAQIGLAPHTVQHSLGVYGKTELLPEDSVLEISTMCGHAMTSPNLIEYLIQRIRSGKITITEAAKELSATCECGIFNPYRAEKILKKITATEEGR